MSAGNAGNGVGQQPAGKGDLAPSLTSTKVLHVVYNM